MANLRTILITFLFLMIIHHQVIGNESGNEFPLKKQNISFILKMIECCKEGQNQAETFMKCHKEECILEKVPNNEYNMETEKDSFCIQMRQFCCERKLSEINCERGIFAAKYLLANTTTCEEQFISNNLVNMESYRCCLNCQLGIQIAIKYNSLNYCRGSNKNHLDYTDTIGEKTSFEECCFQILDHDHEKDDDYSEDGNSGDGPLDVGINDDSNESNTDSSYLGNTILMNNNQSPNLMESIKCNTGFKLNTKDGICEDINECQIGTHNCHEALRCDNTIGSYICVRVQDCGTGYTINADTYECEDVDECALNIHHCGKDYRCRNTQGSFKCERIRCPSGQTLVKGFCRNTKCSNPDWNFDFIIGRCRPRQDPCADNPCHPTERCVIKDDDQHQCVPLCHSGFRYNDLELKCEDVDECVEGMALCGPNQLCQNLEGSFKCVCQPGYEYNNHRQCIDINECLIGEAMLECSRQSKICINIPGSYRCECGLGFYWNSTTHKCQDRNECLEWNRCEQICLNTIGSYVCQCRKGYRLMVNKHNCTDIDECRIGILNPLTGQKPCRGICINEIGSFRCQCPKNFKLVQNRCVDINECKLNPPCTSNQHCINLYGSYKCAQIECQPGYVFKRTEQSIRCIWNGDLRKLPSLGDYHQYEYLYFNLYRNQTNFLNGTNSLYLYTVRFDMRAITPAHFELHLKSAEWLSVENDDYEIYDQYDPIENAQLAQKEHFKLLRNRYEASVNIIWPLNGPQKIDLELLSAGFRHSRYVRYRTILTIIVSMFNRF